MLIHEMHLYIRLVCGVLRMRLGLLDPLFVRDRNLIRMLHTCRLHWLRENPHLFSARWCSGSHCKQFCVLCSVFLVTKLTCGLPVLHIRTRVIEFHFLSMVRNKWHKKESSRAVVLPVSQAEPGRAVWDMTSVCERKEAILALCGKCKT